MPIGRDLRPLDNHDCQIVLLLCAVRERKDSSIKVRDELSGDISDASPLLEGRQPK